MYSFIIKYEWVNANLNRTLTNLILVITSLQSHIFYSSKYAAIQYIFVKSTVTH